MPDVQQPNSQIMAQFGFGGLPGPPAQCMSWPNYCAPASAANIWQFYDNRDGTVLAPWLIGAPLDDLPQPGNPPGVPFGWSISWSNATIQGQGADPAAGRLPLHMNTNDALGCLGTGSAWNGTRIVDSFFGTQSYAWIPETANAKSKLRYVVSATIDEVAPYVPDDPGSVVTITDEGTAFANYCAAIESDVPAILSFRYWVNPATKYEPGDGIEYYDYNTTGPSGNPGGNPDDYEEWGELSGHAVTGIGFRKSFDPDGEGNLPLTDWYIVRDNWMSTGRDVAVPLSEYWKATLYLNKPGEPDGGGGHGSANLKEVDFSVDNDAGPTGLYSSDVYNEELIGENGEDDFYLTPFPPATTNIKTFDENIPPGFLPALNFGTYGVTPNLPMPENTDGYCFGTSQYTVDYNTWPDRGDGTVDLPVPTPYFSPNEYVHIIDGLPTGTELQSTFTVDSFFDVSVTPGGSLGGEIHQFQATLHLDRMIGSGSLAGFQRSILIPIVVEVHVGPRTPGNPVQIMDTDWFSLQGSLFGDPDFETLQIVAGTAQGLPSPGTTTLTNLPSGDFTVDSFFDITYQIDFAGAPGSVLDGLSGSTTTTMRIKQGGLIPGAFLPGEAKILDEAVREGRIFIQFTVDTTAFGMPGSAVRFEQGQAPSEAAGDVYEAMRAGVGNVLIADDFTLGLETTFLDDINSLVIPDEHLQDPVSGKAVGAAQGVPFFANLPLVVDTDGDKQPDAPRVFFSIKNTGLQNSLGGGKIGDFVLMTAPYSGGGPTLNVAWTAANLGLPGDDVDELDALFVENPGSDQGAQPANPPFVYFSLAAGSQSLGNSPTSPIANPFTGSTGCDPGDIIGVRPAVMAGVSPGDVTSPVFGPAVVIRAGTLGLVGNGVADDGLNDDDLNGLHMSKFQFETDLDGNGLGDGWEAQNGVSDPGADEDNDGLNNAAEYVNGTDPNAPDTDGDGYADSTEVAVGTDPHDPNSFDTFTPVWVDFGWTGERLGLYAHPCKTLAEAVAKVQTGGTVRIRGNVATTTSTETPHITKAMRIKAESGAIRIGVVP